VTELRQQPEHSATIERHAEKEKEGNVQRCEGR
jgi:hypothetical protein